MFPFPVGEDDVAIGLLGAVGDQFAKRARINGRGVGITFGRRIDDDGDRDQLRSPECGGAEIVGRFRERTTPSDARRRRARRLRLRHLPLSCAASLRVRADIAGFVAGTRRRIRDALADRAVDLAFGYASGLKRTWMLSSTVRRSLMPQGFRHST